MPTQRHGPTSPDATGDPRGELGFEAEGLGAPSTLGELVATLQLGQPPPGGAAFRDWLEHALDLASSSSTST